MLLRTAAEARLKKKIRSPDGKVKMLLFLLLLFLLPRVEILPRVKTRCNRGSRTWARCRSG